MEHIQVTVTFPKITPDDLDELKRLAGEALKIAAGEPGVLQYDWSDSSSASVSTAGSPVAVAKRRPAFRHAGAED